MEIYVVFVRTAVDEKERIYFILFLQFDRWFNSPVDIFFLLIYSRITKFGADKIYTFCLYWQRYKSQCACTSAVITYPYNDNNNNYIYIYFLKSCDVISLIE